MSELQRLQISRLAELPASVRVTIHADKDGIILAGLHAGRWSGYAASGHNSPFDAIDRVVSKWSEAIGAAIYSDAILKAAGLR